MSAYGALPKSVKEFVQPLYNEIIRLKFEVIKKKVPMTEEEQINALTINSKLENFDNLDSALTTLKKVLFNLEDYTGS